MEYLFYSDFGAFEPFLGPKNAFSTHLRKFLDQMVMLIAFAFKFPIISAISRLITRSTVRVLYIGKELNLQRESQNQSELATQNNIQWTRPGVAPRQRQLR